MAKSKTKLKETTTVAVQDIALTKENVPQLLEVVNARIKNLQLKYETVQPITKELEHFGRIDKITTLSTLVAAHSSLKNRERFYKESGKELIEDVYGRKTPEFIVEGHSVSEWVNEIKNRINYLINKNEIEKLNRSKAILENHLSEEMKLAKDLEAIQKDLLTDELK